MSAPRKLACSGCLRRWWRGVRGNLQPGDTCPHCSTSPLIENDREVTCRFPHLLNADRLANYESGRCHCGEPARRLRGGWRRCMWSQDIDHRVVNGRLEYRHRPLVAAGRRPFSLTAWNDAKTAAGMPSDRQVHALLRFMLYGGTR